MDEEVEAPRRTFDLEKLVRWAFANGHLGMASS
jgi:hypothetical protein